MKKIDFHIHTKDSILDAPFEFCQSKLDEYIELANLDCIAITNHNLFDKAQFKAIQSHIRIPVFPGIEVDLEKGQILVISDGTDLDSFGNKCDQVAAKCSSIGDSIGFTEFQNIFGDLAQYIFIPHYDKKPALRPETLKKLSPHVTAGEVSSPKKFMYCIKSEERLVPVYFSDCRIRKDLSLLPTRQTFLGCMATKGDKLLTQSGLSFINQSRQDDDSVNKDDMVAGVRNTPNLSPENKGKKECKVSMVAGAHNYRNLHAINIHKNQLVKEIQDFINEHSTCFSCKA